MWTKKSKSRDIQKQRRLYRLKSRLILIFSLISLLVFSLAIYLNLNLIKTRWEVGVKSFIDWTAKSGLVVDEIFISGRHHTTQKDILKALNINVGDPMLNFDMSHAKNNLEKNEWINHVTILRRWPDTLYINITERSPMALWQHKNKLRLVDEKGQVFHNVDTNKYDNLPIIIGMNAPKQLPRLLDYLKGTPGLFERVTSATWVGNRRWDLNLGKNLKVLLPEHDVEQALKRFQKYEKHHKISLNAFHKIDLRLKNRLIID